MIVSDVTGDGVPELLFVEKSPYSEEYIHGRKWCCEADLLCRSLGDTGCWRKCIFVVSGGRRIVALLVQWHAG